ncbi:oxygenase MpaB family protein [Thalassobaculum sp. OXR-137]|uniref:oxygenase MpaB family protein n=1 Tax=Thalassobaculum sp. OXR-137 TaxID=3100173 RepID=UPI002AC9A30B|nr:oxygenase MpaB family protein [Thalassobaculum sp. OXR-137]WPZ32450.1 oxygenase MpaB family protein [Thalassobaculum sp. OXR-137]
MPTAYLEGYARAAGVDRALADRYVAATRIGDPEADALMAELQRHNPVDAQSWIARGIEGDPSALDDAPESVRAFFADIDATPPWVDRAGFLPGCRAFHRNSEMFVGAFVAAVLIEGFSTLISQSFSITGRIVDQGVRRLKQNNRQLVEIFLPGGLDRTGDGWKLSVRVRLVHARIRQLLAQDPEWDESAWGTPLSAAHMAYATASFSGLLLKRAAMLGVTLSDEERTSFMQVWRYSAHLMGVPHDLLFTSEDEALWLHRIGSTCEPPPTMESIILANGLINSAPLVAGFTEPKSRRALARKIYRISRAMIGDDLADQLNYPPMNTRGTLALLRLKNGAEQVLYRIAPSLGARRRASQFQTMLTVSLYGEQGASYRLPQHAHAEKDGLL